MSLESRYNELAVKRQPFLDMARACAALTIPWLLRPSTARNSRQRMVPPNQSLGAALVNWLASKITTSMVPPGQPAVKLGLKDADKAKLLMQEGGAEQLAAYDMAFSMTEQAMKDAVDSSTARSKVSETSKHLIVTGNVLLHMPSLEEMQVFKLDTYVVQLDSLGTPIEVIVQESLSPKTLPQDVVETCKIDGNADEDVYIYTGIKLVNGRYEEWQELNGIEVPDSRGSKPKDKLAWLPLRLYEVDGESYGRSYVEEYRGDLVIYDTLSKSLKQGAVASAKILFLVDPTGTTKKASLSKALNGDFVDGRAVDVQALQLNKFADMRVAFEQYQEIGEKLGKAFLAYSAMPRQAERVTTYELSLLAQELEQTLGGIYTLLAHKFQYPMAYMVLDQLIKAKLVPPLIKSRLRITVTTGVAALGRGQDAERLRQLIGGLVELGMQQVISSINVDELVSRMASAYGVDTKNLIKSQEQLAQEQNQAMQQQFMMQAGTAAAPEMAKQMMSPEVQQQMQQMQQEQQPPPPTAEQ